MKEIDYSKLRLDVLQKLVNQREIECRETKNEIIKHLLLDDQGKYIRETTIEKYEKNKFLIGIDLGNHQQLIEMGKLVQSGAAKDTNSYYNCRKYFITDINPFE